MELGSSTVLPRHCSAQPLLSSQEACVLHRTWQTAVRPTVEAEPARSWPRGSPAGGMHAQGCRRLWLGSGLHGALGAGARTWAWGVRRLPSS